MFVVFEGIDGSGKTTVSNRVAKKLRAMGIEVEHVREGGEFASPLVTRMRLFGKDPQNMSMAPLTEFLFYVARDAQVLAENVLPALQNNGLVFADRYLYSYEVLGHYGRQLPLAQVRPVLDAVANGVWPDLVVLMDVDPYVARARRKVSKMHKKARGEKKASSGGSRKGLKGIGTMHRLREGYRKLAERDPDRWLVIENSNTDEELDEIVAKVVGAIEKLWNGTPAAEITHGPQSRGADVDAAAIDFDWGRDRFYSKLEARAVREPDIAAYFLSAIKRDERAHAMREQLAERSPVIVAHGLRGNGSDGAWELRTKLVSAAPVHIARSLDGLEVEGPRAEAMRLELVDSHPGPVLATIDGVDNDAAWALRDRLAGDMLRDVVSTVKRIDTDRAWALRDRYIAEMGEGLYEDRYMLSPLLGSLRGIGDERAWTIRRASLIAAPGPTLWSLVEVYDDESWALRAEYVDQAPKIVLRTFDGVDDPRAWELRAAYAIRAKEALDSMAGLDTDPAWALRHECANVWPSTTVKSLGDLGLTGRGREMALELLRAYPDNISLLKHITRLAVLDRATAAQ
jgi:dTMP kinase